MKREETVEKIRIAKSKLQSCGPLHRRDLLKYIHRMEKELKIYDSYAKRG